MRSSACSALPRTLPLVALLLFAGCAREAPEVREVRKFTEDYFKALEKRDVNAIAQRSSCITPTNSLVGARVLVILPAQRVGMGVLETLVRRSFAEQKSADSLWRYATEANAESLFTRARHFSDLAALYRNAVRAVGLSAPGVAVPRDSTLEVRAIRARFRYAGPVVGPRPVDREELLRLLRAPTGTWVVFSVFPTDQDPGPEMI